MKKIDVSLNGEFAVVLFEFLAEFLEGRREIIGMLPSEKIVLCEIEAQLEKKLIEPFQDDYESIVNIARAKIEKDISSSE
ncbi:hypothetical protein PJ900_11300 [Tistrella mobilis]|uniref:hypothetical protein n=1 Tax=Tistrella mobilis TaxID=171437 RepID=UPI003556BF44